MPLRYDDDEPTVPVVPVISGLLPKGLYNAFGAACDVAGVVTVAVAAGGGGAEDQLGATDGDAEEALLELILLRYEVDEPIDPAPTAL